MRHHLEMLDIPSERWQPYCHPDAASSRDARYPRRALAPYCHPWATRRPPISTRPSTRDDRCHSILIEVYGKSSYGNDLKPTTNSTYQSHLKTIKRDRTMNTITFRLSLRQEIPWRPMSAGTELPQSTRRKSRLSRSSRGGSTSRKRGQ
jgi:hypothetical protein